MNHQFIFPLISHLRHPTQDRVQKIFKDSHYAEIIIYLAVGIMGYLLLSEHDDTIPIAPLVITSISTIPLVIGKLTLTIAMFFNIPLQIFTARQFTF